MSLFCFSSFNARLSLCVRLLFGLCACLFLILGRSLLFFDDSFGGHQFGLLVKVFSVFESLSEK